MPQRIIRALRDTEIIVAGSGVKDDLEGLELEANRIVDTRSVFRQAMYGSEPVVRIGYKARVGLGAQGFYAKNYDYKACKAAQYNKWYGSHEYSPKWPPHRSIFTLFRWARRSDGNLPEAHVNYMYQDGSSVASLVAKLIIDGTVRGSFSLEGKGAADCIADVLGPDFSATDTAEIIGGDNSSSSDSESSTTDTGKSQVDSDVAQPLESGDTNALITTTGERKRRRNSEAGEGPSGVKFGREEGQAEVQPVREEADSQNVSTGTINIDDSTVSVEIIEERQRLLQGTSFSYWDHDLHNINPYIPAPRFPKCCTFCGSTGHSKRTAKGDALCPKMIAHNGSDLCEYVRCRKKSQHCTKVCPYLHARCLQCAHRGHTSNDRCGQWREMDWQRAREEFEAAAGEGMWTQSRRKDIRYGFFTPLIRITRLPCIWAYDEMVERPVREVDLEMDLRPRKNVEGEARRVDKQLTRWKRYREDRRRRARNNNDRE